MGKNITLVGGNGDGQTCKVANQIIVALNIAAVGEALLFASKAETDPAKVRQALMGGFAASRILEVQGERMIKRTFDPGFRIGLHQDEPGAGRCPHAGRGAAANRRRSAAHAWVCAANGMQDLDRYAGAQPGNHGQSHCRLNTAFGSGTWRRVGLLLWRLQFNFRRGVRVYGFDGGVAGRTHDPQRGLSLDFPERHEADVGRAKTTVLNDVPLKSGCA